MSETNKSKTPPAPTKPSKVESMEEKKAAPPAEEKKAMTAEERAKAEAKGKVLDAALGQITRQFGKGSIMRLGKAYADLTVSAIPTGALVLDLALGIGGIPRGRITELYGPESSGKTTLALHIVAEAQRLGGTAAFIDVEHALDPTYAQQLGVNIDELLVSQPSTGEEALEIADMLIKSAVVDVIVIDSVAALVPKAELEGEMGDSHVGLQARLMSQAMRKITGSLKKSGTAAIFINQIRMKIGVMFGNPETTTGGNALKFYASVRLDIRRVETLKDGEEEVGSRVRVKVAKNKVAPPFKRVEFDVLFGEGISKEGNLLDLALNEKVIEKSGSWWAYGDVKIGQGRENARAYLKEHPELAVEIENKILSKYTKIRRGPPVEESVN